MSPCSPCHGPPGAKLHLAGSWVDFLPLALQSGHSCVTVCAVSSLGLFCTARSVGRPLGVARSSWSRRSLRICARLRAESHVSGSCLTQLSVNPAFTHLSQINSVFLPPCILFAVWALFFVLSLGRHRACLASSKVYKRSGSLMWRSRSRNLSPVSTHLSDSMFRIDY